MLRARLSRAGRGRSLVGDVPLREQYARLRAAAPLLPRSSRFPKHAVLGELEMPFVCTVCGEEMLVGPCWEHIVPSRYVCGGCQEAAGEVETAAPERLAEATGQDGTGRNPQGAGVRA